VALIAVISLLTTLLLPMRVSSLSNSAMAVLGVLAIVGASVEAINRGEDGAGMFLGAWSFLLLGALVMVAHNNAWIPSNSFSANALLLGSAAEMILLSLVLGNNLRIAQLDKDAALEFAADEKAIADDLAESEARNRALLAERDGILNSAVVGMVVTRAGKIEWLNGKAAAMFGCDSDALLGASPDVLFKKKGEWWRLGRHARSALRKAGAYEGELELKRTDGTSFWAMVGGSSLGNDAEAATVWSVLDVQTKHESQEQMRKALAEQRKLTTLRSRFVAMASHELRTPLASILSTQELLTHYQDRLSETEKAELLEQIRSSAQRLWGMTERMLLQGKAEAGKLECAPEIFDAENVVRETALAEHERIAAPSADFQTSDVPSADALDAGIGLRAESGVRAQLVFDIESPIGPFCGDPKLLRHVVSNLVSNALKYSPLGGVVRVILERRPFEEGDALRLEVHDEGIGIPQAALPHVFESFHRAANVGDIAGTGIGLSIVKQCVEVHGGEIFIESFEGKGTRVMVNLPEQDEPEQIHQEAFSSTLPPDATDPQNRL
jgi:PAS domain S-box-containing protein